MSEIERLGKYQIQSVLGQGAMGVVYQGFDPVIGRTVALKTIRKGDLAAAELEPLLSRLKHEAQAAGRLTHPGIVTVYDYGEEGETAFIAMECVQGRELTEVLERGERLNLAAALDIINQLLCVLAYSHAHGVVHRDIKPGNILLLADGRIKVTDFGIAKIEAADPANGRDCQGTPSYMSPEQFEGLPVDNRTDLFSAGVILYHLLTGEKPFPGNSMVTIMHRVMHTIPAKVSELNGQLPASLDPVVEKSLAKKADDRFQSADEFSQALIVACRGTGLVGKGEAAGSSFPRSHSVEATVVLTEAEAAHPAPLRSGSGEVDQPRPETVSNHRRLLVVVGLVLLALAAGWLGSRFLGHPEEPRRETASAPAATPAPARPEERADTAANVPAQTAAPAAPIRRRPATGAGTSQPSPPKSGVSHPLVKSPRINQPSPPNNPTRTVNPEALTPPPAAPSAPVTATQVSPAPSPVVAATPAPRSAINGPPGLGRKLREDEW